MYILVITHIYHILPPLEPTSASLCHFRYGGISVGAINSQVRLNEAAIEAAFRDLKDLFSSLQVCNKYFTQPVDVNMII